MMLPLPCSPSPTVLPLPYRAKKAKKDRAAKPPPDAAGEQLADEAAGSEAAEVPEAEGSLELPEGNAGALCEAAAGQLAAEEDQMHATGRAGGSGAARAERSLGMADSTDAEPGDGFDEDVYIEDEEGQEEYAGTPTTPTGAEEDEAAAMLQVHMQHALGRGAEGGLAGPCCVYRVQ